MVAVASTVAWAGRPGSWAVGAVRPIDRGRHLRLLAPGLLWPAAFLVLWAAGLLVIQAGRGRFRDVPAIVRREYRPGDQRRRPGLVLLPQAHRMWEFSPCAKAPGSRSPTSATWSGRSPAGRPWASGRTPTTGCRPRLPSPVGCGRHGLSAIAFGSFWALRRGRWLLPLSAAAAFCIWIVWERSQSPYVSAKALVVASPLLLLVAALPLVDETPPRAVAAWPRLCCSGRSSSSASSAPICARSAQPGRLHRPRPPAEGFRSLIAGEPTLFLGEDEFIGWEARREPVGPRLPRPPGVLLRAPRRGKTGRRSTSTRCRPRS